MDKREYRTIDEFANDVRLIFNNCYKYNPKDHDVVLMAKKVQNFFESRYCMETSVRKAMRFIFVLEFILLIFLRYRFSFAEVLARFPEAVPPHSASVSSVAAAAEDDDEKSSTSSSGSSSASSSDSEDSEDEKSRKLLQLQEQVRAAWTSLKRCCYFIEPIVMNIFACHMKCFGICDKRFMAILKYIYV